MEAANIIEDVFKAHWSTWKFPLNETKFWMERLVKFDHKLAVDAIDKLYEQQEHQRKPAPAAVLGALRRHATIKTDNPREVVPLYEIIRPDGRRKFFPFCGPKDAPIEAIEEEALRIVKECNKKEQGHYINYFVGKDPPI